MRKVSMDSCVVRDFLISACKRLDFFYSTVTLHHTNNEQRCRNICARIFRVFVRIWQRAVHLHFRLLNQFNCWCRIRIL